MTGCDDPLDAGLADTPDWLDEAPPDDELLVEVLVAAVLAGAAAITATKPLNAAAATPVATHRARAAA